MVLTVKDLMEYLEIQPKWAEVIISIDGVETKAQRVRRDFSAESRNLAKKKFVVISDR